MHCRTLEILACPSCRGGFRLTAHERQGERVTLGFLQCPGCGVVVPIAAGLVLFTEPLPHAGLATAEALAARRREWFGSAADFAAAARERHARGVLEPYAAFQPFNESSRALEPLLPHVTPHLAPGDFILDAWCRTGYSGEWLAGHYPDNHVVAVWEGNRSVLGYRGFAHLLGPSRRAPNLDIVLTHPERPLPFADGAFALVHALDALHRYSLYPFAGECLRVARPRAPLVFAHLHLSNSQPQPYFERGCNQWHGRDWRAWLDRLCADGRRRGWVFSELALFDGPTPAPLADDSDTPHYNGLAALLPADAGTAAVPAPRVRTGAPTRQVLSPLFRLNLARRSVRVLPSQHDGAVAHLLHRHPGYARRLPSAAETLDDTALALVLLSVLGLDEARMRQALTGAEAQSSAMDWQPALAALQRLELLRPVPLSAAAHALQRWHANQGCPVDDADAGAAFWQRLTSGDAPLLLLEDGAGVNGDELGRLAAALAAALPALGWTRGTPLTVQANAHPLLPLLALLACGLGQDVRLSDACDAPVPGPLLCGDARSGAAASALPLGADGAEPSLLARLSPLLETADTVPPFVDGHLTLCWGGRTLRLPLSAWAGACGALLHQVDRQAWLFQGTQPLDDLLALLLAVHTGTPQRWLPAAGG